MVGRVPSAVEGQSRGPTGRQWLLVKPLPLIKPKYADGQCLRGAFNEENENT